MEIIFDSSLIIIVTIIIVIMSENRLTLPETVIDSDPVLNSDSK